VTSSTTAMRASGTYLPPNAPQCPRWSGSCPVAIRSTSPIVGIGDEWLGFTSSSLPEDRHHVSAGSLGAGRVRAGRRERVARRPRVALGDQSLTHEDRVGP